MNLPNALTVVRLLLVPVVPVLFTNNQPFWALFVYLLAGLTDVLDGYLARRLNQITTAGKVLDPLADKLMLLTVLICLLSSGHIPLWITVIMFLKEAIMIVAGSFLYRKDIVIPANIFGKIATFLFLPAIVLSFFSAFVSPWHIVLLCIATLSSYIALVQYGLILLKELKNKRAV